MKRGLVCLMQHSVKTLTCSARAGTQHHAGLVIDPTSQDVSHPSLCLPHHFIFVRQPPVSPPPSSFHLRTSATRLSASLIISSSYVSHPSLCLPHHFIFVRQPPVSLPPSSFHLRTSATRLSASLIISSSYVSHPSLCLPHHFIFVRQPPVSLPPSSFHLRTSATRHPSAFDPLSSRAQVTLWSKRWKYESSARYFYFKIPRSSYNDRI